MFRGKSRFHGTIEMWLRTTSSLRNVEAIGTGLSSNRYGWIRNIPLVLPTHTES